LTIKGEGCKLEALTKLTDLTNGNVTRVMPEDIAKDFANILSDEVVGTDVRLTLRIHKGLAFRNEFEGLNEDKSICEK